jgi:hypothetical protein
MNTNHQKNMIISTQTKTNAVIETVEEALIEMGKRISHPSFAEFVRQTLSLGSNLRYEMIVKKSNASTFVVSLNYKEESPKKSISTLIRLQ